MFDLDKVLAEAPKPRRKTKPFEFTFDGSTYAIPMEPGKVDELAVDAAQRGDGLTALKRLLGPEQFATLQATKKTLTRSALWDLLAAYYEQLANGLTVGESAASSQRSKSTARPSKRTSKPAIKSVSRL